MSNPPKTIEEVRGLLQVKKELLNRKHDTNMRVVPGRGEARRYTRAFSTVRPEVN